MKRVDQWLANLGYCSRREAKDWVAADRVTLAKGDGGTVIADDPGLRCRGDSLSIDGEPLDHPDGLLLALHKPLGLVCSHDAREGPRVYDLFPPRWLRRHPSLTTIGRLDRDTSGLLILTDQSPLVHRLTSPKHGVTKLYEATLDGPAPPEMQRQITQACASGSLLLEGESKPCLPAELHWTSSTAAHVVLSEGRYHQARRMFVAASGGQLRVSALHRTRFGALSLPQSLASGQFIELPLDYSFG